MRRGLVFLSPVSAVFITTLTLHNSFSCCDAQYQPDGFHISRTHQHVSALARLHAVWGMFDKGPLPQWAERALALSAQHLQISRVIVWNRTAVERMLDEDWLDVWVKLPRKVSRADIASYLIAYKFGGFYLDLDALVVENPLPVPGKEHLREWDVLLAVENVVRSADELGPRESPHLTRIAQHSFATVPHHPFWRAVLTKALSRCRELLRESDATWSDQDVIWATVDVVTAIYHERFIHDQSVMLRGPFTAHLAMGSWRDGADSVDQGDGRP